MTMNRPILGAAVQLDADSPELLVGPLPEPTAPPWGDDGAASEEGASTPPAGPPELPGFDAVEQLTGLVQVPFALVALVRGRHWELDDAEAGRIARPLARALPPAWLMNRYLAASPWLVVATATYAAVGSRLAFDQALAAASAAEESPADDTAADSAATSGPGTSGNERRPPGPALDGADGVTNPSGFEGVGLGLGEPAARPSGRRGGRGRGDAGGSAAPSSN